MPSGKASGEIDLPDTYLFGRVLSEEGQPIAGATVDAVRGRMKSPVSVRTDGEGSFTIRGLEEGAGRVYAEALSPPATGDPVSLSLTSGQPFGPVELRLRRMKPLAGQVMSPLGPVPGAVVTVFSRRPDFLSGDEVRTDLARSFTAKVPASTGAHPLLRGHRLPG